MTHPSMMRVVLILGFLGALFGLYLFTSQERHEPQQRPIKDSHQNGPPSPNQNIQSTIESREINELNFFKGVGTERATSAWAGSLVAIEEKLIHPPTRNSTLQALSDMAANPAARLEARLLATLLLGRAGRPEADRLLTDLIDVTHGKVAVGAAYAVSLTAVDTKEDLAQRRDFWLGLLAGFNLGEMICRGFRQALANELAGLPPYTDHPVRITDGTPIPFEAYLRKLSKAHDATVQEKIAEVIRRTREPSICESMWSLLPKGPVQTVLAKQIAIDPDYSVPIRRGAIDVLSAADPEYLCLAAHVERNEEMRVEIMERISYSIDPKRVLHILDRELGRNSNPEPLIAAIADGISRRGQREAVEYLCRVAPTIKDDDCRLKIISALGEKGPNEEIEQVKERNLLQFLAGDNDGIRRQAMSALVKLRGAQAREVLEQIYHHDPSPVNRDLAGQLLEQLRLRD